MNKTILITGATSGLGRATLEKFWNGGWQVIGTGRRKDRLEELAGKFRDRFLPLVFDAGNRLATESALGSLPPAFASIDVLINNAGLFLDAGPAQDAVIEKWEQMVQTNIMGVLYCTRAILPGMLERRSGHIVNISSAAALRPARTANVYAASKAFVRLFSDNLRCDLLGSPIRVSCISPGRTLSEFSLVHANGNEKEAEKDYARCEPLEAVDIANAIWWIVSCPPRMDVSQIELMPTGQADSGSAFAKIC